MKVWVNFWGDRHFRQEPFEGMIKALTWFLACVALIILSVIAVSKNPGGVLLLIPLVGLAGVCLFQAVNTLDFNRQQKLIMFQFWRVRQEKVIGYRNAQALTEEDFEQSIEAGWYNRRDQQEPQLYIYE